MEGETPGGSAAGEGADIRPLQEDDPAALGPYTLLGRLATGGMGRVFLARSAGDGSLAAVKTLLAEGEIDAIVRRRFAREVKVARRADGVRTARVLDADPDAPWPWMATEYVPAPSVAELVRRAGPLAGTGARWVTRGALESLAELHRQGIVHRDVKPQNLLLELAGPCLIDFGISHAADLTRTQLTLGTVAFTSPEQAVGEPSTAASDVYSLGATLFHLAVGRPPYPADTEMLLLLTYVAEGRTDLAGLPDELAPVVRACLALSPADRPRTRELLDLFTFELAEFPTVPDASGWLPAPWARLIQGYARQARTLAADPRVLREGGEGPEWPGPEGGGRARRNCRRRRCGRRPCGVRPYGSRRVRCRRRRPYGKRTTPDRSRSRRRGALQVARGTHTTCRTGNPTGPAGARGSSSAPCRHSWPHSSCCSQASARTATTGPSSRANPTPRTARSPTWRRASACVPAWTRREAGPPRLPRPPPAARDPTRPGR
ncbi:serine/threonine-protein kinase [Streptomyces sp. NPDC004134]|uniref:serine/threonine-protein kinase n=1 Tax=Streptomyces sp. NPDC004134 TaxID=3364691 RepID=UPI00369B33ED